MLTGTITCYRSLIYWELHVRIVKISNPFFRCTFGIVLQSVYTSGTAVVVACGCLMILAVGGWYQLRCYSILVASFMPSYTHARSIFFLSYDVILGYCCWNCCYCCYGLLMSLVTFLGCPAGCHF